MSRIDVATLVEAFENRIAALNKNPIEVIPQKTIISMLKSALEDEMKSHFVYLIQRSLRISLQKEFKTKKAKFVNDILKDIITDSSFKETLKKTIKVSIVNNIKRER